MKENKSVPGKDVDVLQETENTAITMRLWWLIAKASYYGFKMQRTHKIRYIDAYLKAADEILEETNGAVKLEHYDELKFSQKIREYMQ